jgi:hypothetical protein
MLDQSCFAKTIVLHGPLLFLEVLSLAAEGVLFSGL